MANDIHLIPLNDLVDHDETRECWCHPELEQVCPICWEEDDPQCWRCNGVGAVPVFDASGDCIVTHNAIDGRE